MLHIFGSSQFEGQSTSHPHFFDGFNYGYWKKRMSCFLIQDINILQFIKKEVKLLDMEKMEEWMEEDKRTVETNARPMNTLLCALCPEEFNWVSTCKTAKEKWDK